MSVGIVRQWQSFLRNAVKSFYAYGCGESEIAVVRTVLSYHCRISGTSGRRSAVLLDAALSRANKTKPS
jgi:hypothetical protein